MRLSGTTPKDSASRSGSGSEATHPFLLWALRISTAFCFWGWGWQHIRWDVPYREVLWSPDLFGWFVHWLGLSWESYVGSAGNDALIQSMIRETGLLFILFGILALTVQPKRWGHYFGLGLGALWLLFIAYLCYLDKMMKVGQFVEYGSQILIPVILCLVVSRGAGCPLALNLARAAVIFTFAGHGLYAIGFYEVPGHFITMTMSILGVSQPVAEEILMIAGGLDFLICLAVFHPVFFRPVLIYAVVWGFLTALARSWAGLSTDYAFWGIDQYLHLTLLRLPHAALPLYLLLAATPRTGKTRTGLQLSPPANPFSPPTRENNNP